MKKALATFYRPTLLEEIIGQEYVIKILEQQLLTNNIKNCYLFCGPSGVGKTTIARAFANKINKNKGSIIEVDAASNSSVDNVRNLIDSANTKALSGEYKIFIVDECHSLSNQAWQAFLKTLEEPNAKTIFMFCTTEVQKVPTTILNRVQRFDLKTIESNLIIDRLKFICEKENFKYDIEALNYICKLSKGRLRDAIAYLEKVSSLSTEITLQNTFDTLNIIDYPIYFKLINSIIDANQIESLKIIQEVVNKGKDLKEFVNEFTTFIMDLNKYLLVKDFELINIPRVYENQLLYSIKINDAKEFFNNVLFTLITLKEDIRFENDIRTNLEVTIIKLCK